MLKYLIVIFCCVCVTVVLCEAAAVGVLWQRGMLTDHHLREMKLVLTNSAATDDEEKEGPKVAQFPSVEEVAQARAVKILNLDKRESELTTLKSMADNKRSDLETQQQEFRERRKAFEDELQKLEQSVTSAATEQARGVLLALPPKDAMRQLMQLSLEDDVILMKGMPEKTIAKILKEFQGDGTAGNQPATPPGEAKETPVERGRKIFEALTKGNPSIRLIEQAQKDFATGAEATN